MDSNKRIGAFTLINPLGQGAMGEVWRAVLHRDFVRSQIGVPVSDQIQVAIKFLHLHALEDDWAREGFSSETAATASLRHPHIVTILDYGIITKQIASEDAIQHFGLQSPYLVMELIEGSNWARVAEQVIWPDLEMMIIQILDALSHAHARGVIHRDIKPENIMMSSLSQKLSDQRAILTDFGLAHAFNSNQNFDSESIAGTPAYMAPEQFLGHWRDQGPWTDLYSLGCTIWRMVSTSAPYGNGNEVHAIAKGHIYESIPPLKNSIVVPKGLEKWLQRLIAKRPQERFANAAEAKHALLQIDQSPIQPIDLYGDHSIIDPTQEHSLGNIKKITSTYSSLSSYKANHHTATVLPIPQNIPKEYLESEGNQSLQSLSLYLFGIRSFPLVGRHNIKRQIWQSLHEVSLHGARCLILTGAAGCGKSHIAKWLCEQVLEQGIGSVLHLEHHDLTKKDIVQSSEKQTQSEKQKLSTLPSGFLPALIRDLKIHDLSKNDSIDRLYSLVGHIEHHRNSIDQYIKLLFGDDGHSLSHLGIQREVLSEWEQHGLILQLLLRTSTDDTALSKPNFHVVWIDDAHLGHDSLRFCRSILSSDNASDIPILFVCTLQPEELTLERKERIEFAALGAHPRTTTVNVPSIKPDEHRAILASMLHLSPELLEIISYKTSGNPQYAKQILTEIIKDGALEYSSTGFKLIDDYSITTPTREINRWMQKIESAIASCTKTQGALLFAAGLLGHQFSVHDLQGAFKEVEENKIKSIVDLLIRERLIKEVQEIQFKNSKYPSSLHNYEFVHPILPEILESKSKILGFYNNINKRIVGYLQTQQDYHGNIRRGFFLLRTDKWLEGIELLSSLIYLMLYKCEYSICSSALFRILQTLKQNHTPFYDTKLTRIFTLIHLYARECNNTKLKQHYKEVLKDRLLQYEDTESLAYYILYEGLDFYKEGKLDQSEYLFERVQKIALSLKDEHIYAQSGRGLALVKVRQGKVKKAETILQELFDRLEKNPTKIHTHYNYGMNLLYRSIIYMQKGAFDKIGEYLLQAQRLFEKHSLKKLLAETINIQGDVHRYMKEYKQATTKYEEAFAHMQEINHPDIFVTQINLGLLRVQSERYEEAFELMEPILEQLKERPPKLICAQLICLPFLSSQQRWIKWEQFLKSIEGLLDVTGYSELDFGELLEMEAFHLEHLGETEKAKRCWLLGAQVWDALQDPEQSQILLKRANRQN